MGFTYALPITSQPVRSYRTFSPLPHFIQDETWRLFSVALSLNRTNARPAGHYPALCFCGVRTFLE